jgi:hypothetical protein
MANYPRKRLAPDAPSRPSHHNPFGLAALLTVPLAAVALIVASPSSPGVHAGTGRSSGEVSMVSRSSVSSQELTASSSAMGNPASNIAPDPNFFDYCSGATIDTSSGCEQATLEAIDHARATEGLAPMILPVNWSSLSPAEQLFVATNLERTARGLPAFSGMSSVLDSVAASAAASASPSAEDPVPPAGFASYWTSNWAGGVGSALESIYLWMYADGPNGSNQDCQAGDMSGCWEHREDILYAFTCSPCVMGSGVSASAYGGEPAWAEVMVDAVGSPSIAFPWSSVSTSAPAQTVVGMSANAAMGYWLATQTGTVRAFGGAPNYGSANLAPGEAVVGMTATPDGRGYWLVTSDGAVYAFGNAGWHGGANRFAIAAPIVGITSTPNGDGYWLVGADGGVFSFGNAAFHGSTGNIKLNKPIVGIASTSNGDGYWLVASDGGVFSFGNAAFHGSTGAMRLNRPVVGMTPVAGGGGYWLVASDGGIFSFGDAGFHGSTGALHLAAPMVGMASPTSSGYWLVAADGGIFSFGVPFHGSMA